MCFFGPERPPKRKKKSRLWSPDGSPEAAVRVNRTSAMSTSPLLPSQMIQYRQPDQRYYTASASQPARPARVRRRGSHRHPRSPSIPSPITVPPAAMTYHYRRPSQPVLPVSYQPALLSPPLTSPPPYAYEMAANEPWRAGANLASPVYNSRNRSRIVTTTTNMASSLAGQLHQAAQSVTHLNAFSNSNQNNGFYDRISARLNEVINEIDNEVVGNEEYVVDPLHQSVGPQRAIGPVTATRQLVAAAGGSSAVSSNSFSKVWLYANSRLPPYLPPLKIYMPTYPLLCLAAQYSMRVYNKPTAKERQDHVKASVWHRTKAMTLKSLPMDDMNTIIFAIRGSSSFIDWAVNFRPAPSPPDGFLDDPGNLCHAGFLCIAKGMVKSVAARLRTLLTENPGRSASSLVITGHSAGGAVAQLLYAHMLSKTVDSELNYLAGFFKRVHCITFGTPPVSLLPLTTPKSRQNRKSLFFSFVNEGDPVARADKAVVRSLLKLYATPAPSSSSPGTSHSNQSRLGLKWTKPSTWSPDSYMPSQPIWPVPNGTLSLGGRVILLRPRFQGTGPDDIEAVTVNDEDLRETVFGDPACHTMAMYSKRIEILATQAVTVGGFDRQ